MELGETLCAPNAEARCALCPLSGICRACQMDAARDYPFRSPPRERRRETRTVLLLRCGESYAIRRRPESGLLAGLWEFPNWEGELSPDALAAELGVPLRCTPIGSAKHVFTHVEWQMRGFLADCGTRPEGFEWRTAREIGESFSIPTAFRKFMPYLV